MRDDDFEEGEDDRRELEREQDDLDTGEDNDDRWSYPVSNRNPWDAA